jgi:hypothetical protein
MRVSFFNQAEYKLRRFIGWVLYYTPGLMLIVRGLQKLLLHITNIDRANRETLEAISMDSTKPNQYGSGFGYESPAREVAIADHYRQEIEAGNLNKQKNESGAVYDTLLKEIPHVIESDRTINKVLNFGVSYAYVDSTLAKKYPNILFNGVDRSPLTKLYNEQFFREKNFNIITGNIEDVLKADWKNTLFVHSRVMIFMPQQFAENLYSQVKQSGCKYIVGIEQCGISWEIGKPYNFNLEEQKSVVFRNHLFIHNYPGLLKKFAFETIALKHIDTNHTDPNFKMVFFIGRAT